MPCIPQPGEVTICEINRDLITAQNLSNEGAKETYGKVLGIVFSPIPFQPDLLLPNQEQVADQEHSVAISRSVLHGLKASITDSFKRIFFPNDVS